MVIEPTGLIQPAMKAGIIVPDDPEHYSPRDYPYWHTYLHTQLGRVVRNPADLWENAKIIASLSDKEILNLDSEELNRLLK